MLDSVVLRKNCNNLLWRFNGKCEFFRMGMLSILGNPCSVTLKWSVSWWWHLISPNSVLSSEWTVFFTVSRAGKTINTTTRAFKSTKTASPLFQWRLVRCDTSHLPAWLEYFSFMPIQCAFHLLRPGVNRNEKERRNAPFITMILVLICSDSSGSACYPWRAC